jgi:hypothetical protein
MRVTDLEPDLHKREPDHHGLRYAALVYMQPYTRAAALEHSSLTAIFVLSFSLCSHAPIRDSSLPFGPHFRPGHVQPFNVEERLRLQTAVL